MPIIVSQTGYIAKKSSLIVAWLMFSLLLGAVAAERAEADAVFRLTVLHNNDGESALLSKRMDDAGVEREYGGAALFTSLVKRLKAQAMEGDDGGVKRGVIMLSSGDNFLAGPVFNASLEKGVPYYDSLAMGEIGYDAICIGNHDFDFGPDGLADFIAGFPADTPFLSANLDVGAEPRLAALAGAGRIAASTVIETGGEKIGVVGATTVELPFISSPRKVKVSDATVDFLARGGDQYPFQGAQFINLGVTYQQALRDYIVEALDSTIAADRYPEGGDGRITHAQ